MTTDPRIAAFLGYRWSRTWVGLSYDDVPAILAELDKVDPVRTLLDPTNETAVQAAAAVLHDATCMCGGSPNSVDRNGAAAVLAALSRLAGQPITQEEPND